MGPAFVEIEIEVVAESPSPRRPALATDHAGFMGLIWLAKTDLGPRFPWVVGAAETEIAFGLEADVSAAQRQIAAVIYRCAGEGSILMH